MSAWDSLVKGTNDVVGVYKSLTDKPAVTTTVAPAASSLPKWALPAGIGLVVVVVLILVFKRR